MRKLACLLPGLLLCSAALAAPLDVVDAKKLPDRWYIAPQVWANPWENWQIRDGNIVTSHASPRQPMTLHHLTCELGEAAAGAEMAVTVGLAEAQGDNAGSVGFAVGVRVNDPIDDYRSRLLFGNGMFMGLNTKGVLFIANGTRGAITAADTLNLALTKVRLIASLAPQNDGSYTVVLKATMPKSGAELGRIEKPGVPPDKLVGNVALVANAPQGVSGVAMDALWTFNEWQLNGDKFAKRPERTFGPILWSQYTLSGGVMKLTAQMAPIGERDNQSAVLEVRRESAWEQVASARIDPLSWTAPFRVDPWDASRDTAYRVVWKQAYADGTDETHYWEGAIRRDPAGKPVLTTGLFCCFMDYVFPNRCVAENVARQDPDLLMFVGDQIYENVGGWGILRTGPVDRMCVNYLRKLSLWGWSFRDLMHDRPTVVMPDDHDVYQGNLWGDAGRCITLEEWQAKSGYGASNNDGSVGGYVQPIEFVKAVERTQTSHLPDPATTKVFKQGLCAYFTSMTYGRIGFAILEDRKFKTGPQQVETRHDGPRPDHISGPNMADDVNDPSAKLLGDDQLAFVRRWVADWRGQDMKAAISQTVYCGVATHHGSADNFLLGDMDCGGWPQGGRRKAVDTLRRGGALLLGGDQHLPTLVRHGLDEPGDAIVSFVTPAGAVGYQRWWRPEDVGIERIEDGRHDDRPNTGLYRDGFGNLIDVLAVGNPPLKHGNPNSREVLAQKKSSGWGIVAFDKQSAEIRVEAWRIRPGLNVVENATPHDQFPGWPMAFASTESYGVHALKLPPVVLKTAIEPGPIVRVKDVDGSFVSAGRMQGKIFTPTVYGAGRYTVEVLSPKDDATVVKTFDAVQPDDAGELDVAL